MRDDIVGMLKNAIDHGGNPAKIAQSLINSGYPMKDVKEAYEYVISLNPDLVQKIQQQATQQTQQTQYQQRPQQTTSQAPQSQMQSQQTSQQVKQTQPQQTYSQNTQRPQSNQQVSQSQMPQAPVYRAQTQTPQQLQVLRPSRPLPAQKINPPGKGRIIALSIILLVLIASLVSVIIFKDIILNLLKL